MRIITGKAKGVRLATLPGDAVRPTTEMAKEGIFSAIQFDLQNKTFLDLFAGSGQMGLEAVSRGASYATFVDCSEDSLKVVRKNIMIVFKGAGVSDKIQPIQPEIHHAVK